MPRLAGFRTTIESAFTLRPRGRERLPCQAGALSVTLVNNSSECNNRSHADLMHNDRSARRRFGKPSPAPPNPPPWGAPPMPPPKPTPLPPSSPSSAAATTTTTAITTSTTPATPPIIIMHSNRKDDDGDGNNKHEEQSCLLYGPSLPLWLPFLGSSLRGYR